MTLNVAVLLNASGTDRSASKTATPTFQIPGDGGAATYRCAIDGVGIGDYHTSNAWGDVNVFVSTPLADGKHTFTFEELSPNPGGPPGFPCQPFGFSVDTRPPTAPTILSVTPNAQRPDGKWSLVVKGTIVAGEGTLSVRAYAGFAGIGGANANGTTFSITTTPLAQGTYTIETVAVDSAGNYSARSNGVTITLGSPPQPTIPGVVVALNGVVMEIFLNWSPPPDGGSPITGYRVYQGGVQIGSSTVPGFNIRSPGRGASYTVSAVNAVGEGPQSAPVVPWQ